MEYISKSYLEVEYEVGSVRGCSSGEFDGFVSDDILLQGWQADTKNVFVFWIIGVCRSV